MKQVLAIAGSDSGGGAGIQADLKTIHACGAYGLSVITAVTAQNTVAVKRVFHVPVDVIEAQLEAVFEDFDVAAVKTGMLGTRETVEMVAAGLREQRFRYLVVDPVMAATSGGALLAADAVESLKRYLLPLAALVTPNVDEAQILAGQKIATRRDAEEAARRIHGFGPGAVLVKGGHLRDAPATDVLFDGETVRWLAGEFLDTPHTHGTGCTYAAAIAAHIAQGWALAEAIAAAKRYVTEAIRHACPIGRGRGPVNPLYGLVPAIDL